jgi:O-antigen ligase
VGLNIDLDPNMPLIIIVSFIGIMAILLLGFVNVRYIFYMWVVTLPFSQWSIYDLGFLNLYTDRVILLVLLLMSLFYLSIRKISFSKISVVELLMLCFTLVCIVSAIKSNSLDRDGFGLLLAAYIYPFIGYYLARSTMQKEKDVRDFSVVITYLGLYLAYIGICEQLYPDLVFPRYIVNSTYIISNVGRSVGPSLEPVGYGLGLLFCLLVSIYYFYKTNSLLNPTRIFIFIAFLITPIAIFFTYTRAIWIGLLLSLLVLFLFYPRGKKIFGSLLAILIFSFVLIQTIQVSETEGSAKDVVERDSIYVRLSMAKTGMKMFLDKPVFGVGYSQAGKEFPRYFTSVGTSWVPDKGFLIHNTFVNILVELGLIGFVPFLFILIYLIKDAIILYEKSVDNRDMAIMFLAACAAFIFAAMANNMYYKFAHVLLFCMAGMVKGRQENVNSFVWRQSKKSAF